MCDPCGLPIVGWAGTFTSPQVRPTDPVKQKLPISRQFCLVLILTADDHPSFCLASAA